MTQNCSLLIPNKTSPNINSSYNKLTYNTWKGLTVVHSLRKNGEVTKSCNHTISALSWQGCAQFGFKSKRSFSENLHKQSHVAPCLLMCDLWKLISVFMRDKLSTYSTTSLCTRRESDNKWDRLHVISTVISWCNNICIVHALQTTPWFSSKFN